MTRKSQPYECCVCEKDRSNDANHWWLVWRGLGDCITAQPWLDEVKDAEGVEHVCGLSCLLVRLGRIADAIVHERIQKEKQKHAEQIDQPFCD